MHRDARLLLLLLLLPRPDLSQFGLTRRRPNPLRSVPKSDRPGGFHSTSDLSRHHALMPHPRMKTIYSLSIAIIEAFMNAQATSESFPPLFGTRIYTTENTTTQP